MPADVTGILIDDNPTGNILITSSTTGPVSGPGIIGQADGNGEFHTHIDFSLADVGGFPPKPPAPTLDASEFGAYGLLMELTTDELGVANSDRFYIIFNFGLIESELETAVEDFATEVPEPTCLLMSSMCMALVGVRWRRGR